MSRQRTNIEKAMNARRDEAVAEAEAEHPGSGAVLVGFFGLDVIVDIKDKDANWHRYVHVPATEVDILAAERAESSLRRQEVKHG